MREKTEIQRKKLWIVGSSILAGVTLAACGGSSDEDGAAAREPASVETIEGTDRPRVTLTSQAARRLDIRTVKARDASTAGEPRIAIPYAAVVYDADGEAWTYTSPEPLVFVRQPIAIERVQGDQALLVEGPPAGTEVVTVGVAELYGTELGIE